MTELQIKAAVRERDGHRCTQCGLDHPSHVALYGRTLDVHRVVPGSVYTVEGCVTLCRACHGPAPRRKNGVRIRSGEAKSRTVSLPRPWALVLRRLAARRRQPIGYAVIDMVKAEAERDGMTPLPPTPWDRLAP